MQTFSDGCFGQTQNGTRVCHVIQTKYYRDCLELCSESRLCEMQWPGLAGIPHYITPCRSLPGPGSEWQEAAGVNLPHLWFETSDLKCFTELWSHNVPIPANKCFSLRPRYNWARAAQRVGRVGSAVFYGLLSALMLRSDARYEPGERRDMTNMTQLIGVATHHSQPAQARQEARLNTAWRNTLIPTWGGSLVFKQAEQINN